MTTSKVGTRILALAATVLAVAGLMAFVVPALASNLPGAVRLHLGTDGRYFAYGNQQQALTTSGCRINSLEPIIDLSAGSAQPGLSSNGIGVKGSSSTGTPCGQIEGSETLRIQRGANLGTRQFKGVRLDVEMTGNAVVRLTLASSTSTATYQLQTGRSITTAQSGESDYDNTVPYFASSRPGDEVDACAAPNSSGPNNGNNDNCQWTVMPGFDFDTITLTTSGGTVTLEGAGDFGNDPNFDTLLYLANSAPTANADAFTADEDVPLQANVLSNDTDPDGNVLSAALLTQPTNGSLSLATNGDITYVPDDNWFGTDSFTYQASDGLTTATATATITVRSVNDPPVGAVGDATTSEDTPITVLVATDVDSTALTSACTSSGGGTIVDNGDGTVAFTPPVDFNGPLTLTCTVTDDQAASTSPSASIVFDVTAVNDPPEAADDTAEVAASASVIIDVLANDTDVDVAVLAVTNINNVTPTGATAVANPDGTVTYTPPTGYDGAGSFTYRATDGDATSNSATVAITVFPVICSNDTVTDRDGDVTGSFTRLGDLFECKRYALKAVDAGDTILFAPLGGGFVSYRGLLSFGSEAAPSSGGGGDFSLLLRYDPAGGDDFQPVLWCIDPQFDGEDAVTSATLPNGQSWCIASADTRGHSSGGLITTWQVYGFDDPKFAR